MVAMLRRTCLLVLAWSAHAAADPEQVLTSGPARANDIATPVRITVPDLASIAMQGSYIMMAPGKPAMDVELALDGGKIHATQRMHVTAEPQPLRFKVSLLPVGTYTITLRIPHEPDASITFSAVDTELLHAYATHPPPRVAGAYRLSSWAVALSPWGTSRPRVDRAVWTAGTHTITADIAEAASRADLAAMARDLGKTALRIAGTTVQVDRAADHFTASWVVRLPRSETVKLVRLVGAAPLDDDAKKVIERYAGNFPVAGLPTTTCKAAAKQCCRIDGSASAFSGCDGTIGIPGVARGADGFCERLQCDRTR